MSARGWILAIAFVILFPPRAVEAGAEKFFTASFPGVLSDPGDPAIAEVRRQLEAATRTLQSEPEAGYDWVISALTAETTRMVERELAAGSFHRPDVVRAMVVQFQEIYAANAIAFAQGTPIAKHWRRALSLSRRLGNPGSGGVRTKAAAWVQMAATLYAHMLTDIPVVMLVLERRFEPEVSTEELHRAFREVEKIFPPVIEREMRAARFTPKVLAAAWPRLPKGLKAALVTGDNPLSLAGLFYRFRRLAWLRYRVLRRRSSARAPVAALRPWKELTPLPCVTGGPR